MTIKLPANVVSFAAGDTTLFDNFVDYWNHYQSEFGGKNKDYVKGVSFADKEKALNSMLIREASKRSGIDLTSTSLEQLANHPVLSWSVGNIVSQMIDAVLPATMVEGTSAYAEVRTIGYGESAIFDIKSRDLFPVTKAGRGMRETEMHKGFEKQVTLYPENHMVTVGVSLFRVLAGQESLAEFTVKALRSIETEMTKDIYNAFAATMAALSTDATTGLQVSGYTQADLTTVAQKVSAYSGGAKPIVLGTKLALAKILPADTNVRADIASDYVKVGYVRQIAGIDTFEIPQVANWASPFGLLISDSYLWVVAPGTDKIVKCVIGGATISNVSDQFGSAMLMQNATLQKAWGVGVHTSAVGGCIAL